MEVVQLADAVKNLDGEQLAAVVKMAVAPSKAIGAGLAMFGAIGAGIGLGIYLGNYANALARNPGASGELSKILWVGIGLIEAIALFALVIAFINIYG